ncbi:unnamed protein product [Brassica rapa subsp. narinosa]|uniref:(rape) hypothetical protein n=1 Tax=Brassica napus TaxID=3708 RepID=A0A816NYA1_BRANA|nr:unnamed protein product [Brassica napus]
MPPLRNRSHPLNSVFFCSGNVSENVRLNERIFLIVSQGINKKAWDASGEHCLFQSKEVMIITKDYLQLRHSSKYIYCIISVLCLNLKNSLCFYVYSGFTQIFCSIH